MSISDVKQLVDVEREVFDDDEGEDGYVPTPRVALKDQLELDKDDESLKKWKESLLGSLSISDDKKPAEVTVHRIAILVNGRDPIVVFRDGSSSAATAGSSGSSNANSSSSSSSSTSSRSKDEEVRHTVTLKEGTPYRVELQFSVSNDIVLGLAYHDKVYKKEKQVDKTHVMLGSYGPQAQPYLFVTHEETTPAGIFARDTYRVDSTLGDDDGGVYLQFSYNFKLQKDW